ncbi:MAG: nucleoside-diphosphate kinase [Planctomycetota bacterium]
MAVERTLLLIKPDGYRRGLVGEVIKRLESKGLVLIGLKLVILQKEDAMKLYDVHRNKSFFDKLVNMICSGPVVASIWEGPCAINVVRKLIGKTFGFEAEGGTIRGDFSLSKSQNIVHASDSVESFEHEYKIFFRQEEILKVTEKPLFWDEEDLI